MVLQNIMWNVFCSNFNYIPLRILQKIVTGMNCKWLAGSTDCRARYPALAKYFFHALPAACSLQIFFLVETMHWSSHHEIVPFLHLQCMWLIPYRVVILLFLHNMRHKLRSIMLFMLHVGCTLQFRFTVICKHFSNAMPLCDSFLIFCIGNPENVDCDI